MEKDKNLEEHSGICRSWLLTPNEEDLMAEIQKLRTELKQIREIVSTLFQMVVEEYEEEIEPLVDGKEDFSIYN